MEGGIHLRQPESASQMPGAKAVFVLLNPLKVTEICGSWFSFYLFTY